MKLAPTPRSATLLRISPPVLILATNHAKAAYGQDCSRFFAVKSWTVQFSVVENGNFMSAPGTVPTETLTNRDSNTSMFTLPTVAPIGLSTVDASQVVNTITIDERGDAQYPLQDVKTVVSGSFTGVQPNLKGIVGGQLLFSYDFIGNVCNYSVSVLGGVLPQPQPTETITTTSSTGQVTTIVTEGDPNFSPRVALPLQAAPAAGLVLSGTMTFTSPSFSYETYTYTWTVSPAGTTPPPAIAFCLSGPFTSGGRRSGRICGHQRFDQIIFRKHNCGSRGSGWRDKSRGQGKQTIQFQPCHSGSLSDENGNAISDLQYGSIGSPGTGAATGIKPLSVTPIETPAGSGQYSAFAIFQTPIDFSRASGQDDALAQRKIKIQVSDSSNNVLATNSLTLLRPPLLLVHGIWSDPSPWNQFVSTLRPSLSLPLTSVYYIDYSGLNHAGASINSNTSLALGQTIQNLQGFKQANNAAAAQFDVIAHSMGGLISDQMPEMKSLFNSQQTFGHGYIHKLITIDTPYVGSPFAAGLDQSSPACKTIMDLVGNEVGG